MLTPQIRTILALALAVVLAGCNASVGTTVNLTSSEVQHTLVLEGDVVDTLDQDPEAFAQLRAAVADWTGEPVQETRDGDRLEYVTTAELPSDLTGVTVDAVSDTETSVRIESPTRLVSAITDGTGTAAQQYLEAVTLDVLVTTDGDWVSVPPAEFGEPTDAGWRYSSPLSEIQPVTLTFGHTQPSSTTPLPLVPFAAFVVGLLFSLRKGPATSKPQ